MPRLRFRDWAHGLTVVGPADATPVGGLRRARGVGPFGERLRSRWGATSLYGLAAHTISRFADARFVGAGVALYRNGVSILAGMTGARLALVRMPPTAGVADALFVTGGGVAKKIDVAGAVSNWGIAAPTAPPTATKAAAQSKLIDSFDVDDWVDAGTPPNLTAKVLDTDIKTEGAASLKITIKADTTSGVQKSMAMDLSDFGGGIDSPDEDWISLAIRFDKPHRVEGMQIIFGVDGFFNTTYTKEITIDDQVSKSRIFRPMGLADLAGVHGQEQAWLASAAATQFRLNAVELLGVTRASEIEDTWSVLLIPKSSFVLAGPAKDTATWADVGVVKILVRAAGVTGVTGPAVVYLDDLKLVGGVGKQGSYKLKYSYRNTVTGTRSNASPEFVLEDVQRQPIAWATLAPSTDPQVDQIEGWETLGNGEIFFKAFEVDNGTTTFTDEVADYAGLDSNAAAILDTEELPDDNLPPEATYLDAFGPADGRMFWCRDSVAGARGRIYYSPVGRAEAVQGFLTPTNDDDPTQKGVVWDGRVWCFSEAHLFEVVGTDVLTVREVFGVPGTTAPATVTVTPMGIVYRAEDGLRLFNGVESRLLGGDRVGPLFRGEAAGGLTAFEPIVAVYAHDEVVASDGSQALAVNLRTGAWRDLGAGFNALYAEPDTGLLIAGLPAAVVIWEAEGAVTDAGTPIGFAVETGHVYTGAGERGFVQRLYFDVDTAGQPLHATLLLDTGEVPLPTLVASGRRTIEVPVLRPAKLLGIRLFGSLTAPIQVFGVEADGWIGDRERTPGEKLASALGAVK